MAERRIMHGKGAEPRADVVEQVKRTLGMRSLKARTAVELHERIAEGLPRSAALHLVSGLMSITLDESLRAFNLSRRDWHRFKAEPDKRLGVDQSARVWSMAEILTRAQEVLGTREEAEEWLSRPAPGLDGRRPIDLMSTPQGSELVNTLLARMDYGVYA